LPNSIKNLKKHKMDFQKTIWHSSYHRLDIDSGSLLMYHINDPRNEIFRFSKEWFEVRSSFYFWSHNPSVFNKKILNEKYPDTKSHEYDFGIGLLNKYPEGVIAFWASNPYEGYITHIGHRDVELLKTLPKLKGWEGH
jgi:hypothetical protein